MFNFDKICRLCATEQMELQSILIRTEIATAIDRDGKSMPSIFYKILSCFSIEINQHDELPKQICGNCLNKTETFYEFMEQCQSAQILLTKLLDEHKKFHLPKQQNINQISEKIRKLPNLRVQKVIVPKLTEQQPSQMEKETRPLTLTVSLVNDEDESLTHVDLIQLNAIKSDPLFISVPTTPKEMPHNFDGKTFPVFNNQNEFNDIEMQQIDAAGTIVQDSPVADNDDDDDYVDEDANQSDDDTISVLMNPSSSQNDTTTRTKSPIKQSKSNDTTTTTTTGNGKNFVVVQMTQPAMYICMSCKVKFTTFDQLRRHMQNSEICKQMNLTCETCGKVCETKKSLYQHSMIHRDKFNFICDECGKTYTNRFNLENHMSSVHGEQVDSFGSIYKCKVCDGQFGARRELYAHISTHAKMPSVHLCDTCGKSFKSLESLRSHVRLHQDIRPFACTNCDKRFRSRLLLTQHSHIHTGIKPFNCNYCDKSFAKKGSLVAHFRLHTGDQPYECTMCPQKFSSSNKLKTHTKIHAPAIY